MKLLRMIANLGYGSRKQVMAMFNEGRVTDTTGRALRADDSIAHHVVRIDGAPLDPAPGLVLMLHKPAGVTCSRNDIGPLVFDLLPPRLRLRNPSLSTVGRLDRDTSGLLLLTDDGKLLHRIIAPKSQLPKVYQATLAQPLRGDEAALFAAGTLMLDSETKPLLPAQLQALSPRRVRLRVHEGRYHQVRRMFAAVGNHVQALHRDQIGGLALDHLSVGQWRALDAHDLASLFTTEQT